MPVAEARRQPTPLAALLSDVQNGIENLQVGQTDVATLNKGNKVYRTDRQHTMKRTLKAGGGWNLATSQ